MSEKLRDTTLVFLVKKDGERITHLCLAMKKRGFGAGKWNGVGGKCEAGESIEDAARREAKEEIAVELGPLKKVAELTFIYLHNPAWDQLVHTFICDTWSGHPTESEEMRPEWYPADEIPYAEMWADDPHWIPHMIDGNFVKAKFTFQGDEHVDSNVEILQK